MNKCTLSQAVSALGVLSLASDEALLDPAQRLIALGRDNLTVSVLKDVEPSKILQVRSVLQHMVDLQSQEEELKRVSELLGGRLVDLLRSLSERSIDETRIATMFEFLGMDTAYAVRREGELLFNRGLDTHTLAIGTQRVRTHLFHVTSIDHGELFTCRCDCYEGYFLRKTAITPVEKALVELHLNLLARHVRQQALHRALTNINNMFAQEFVANPQRGVALAEASEAETAERNFTTLLDAALKDSLTQAYNRNKTREMLENLCQRGSEFYVLLLDIDYFKHINDTHGHLVGDRVLVALAHRAQAVIRGTDVLARWGGEEFMVICMDTDAFDLASMGERLRKCVCDAQFEGLAVTVSVGAVRAHPGETPIEVIERADNALYQSKREGRNRVTVQ